MNYGRITLLFGLGIAALGAPAWLALLGGIIVAIVADRPPADFVKRWTPRTLQAGVVALGAGMDLQRVLKVGAEGLGLTALSLAFTLALALALGRWLAVERDTSLLLGTGTAICGGSAIASVASVIKPQAHELSVSLAIVFLLNAFALVVFPPIGHAMNLSQESFGLWAAIAIHDTSSVVGAGLAYGERALDIATTTKLARALWIVPVTVGVSLWRSHESGSGLRSIKWPWFIAAFVALAALFSAVPALEPLRSPIVTVGRRLLVLALFFVGLGLSRTAMRQVGWRPMAQGLLTWLGVTIAALWWVR